MALDEITRTMVGRRAMVGVAVVVLASGCAVSGLSFVQDERVTIHAPKGNATVSLPFTVSWTVDDFGGSFLVFFDRSPMRPNETVRSLVPDGDTCRATPGCPDAAWLADRNIYVTDANSVRVDHLPDRRDNSRAKDRHDVTIVLLDDEGRRQGESVFTREFIVERDH